MEKVQFKGIMPALITPMDANEKLIRPAVGELIEYQLSRGMDGFYVGGATGEGPIIPPSTRMELCEAAIEANRGRAKIIVHVGGPNFTDVQALTKHATECGADGISAMAPNAYFGHSDRELIDYYKRIASLSDKPLLVYVTPLMLGNNLTSVFTELMEVENIIGLKFTQYNYYLLTLLKMINGGNINIINGPDEMLLCGLSMGADGGIGSTYNIMPDRFAALYKAFRASDIKSAREIQFGINRIIRVILEFRGGKTLANVKDAIRLMGFNAGECAFPMACADAAELADLKTKLIAAGLEL